MVLSAAHSASGNDAWLRPGFLHARRWRYRIFAGVAPLVRRIGAIMLTAMFVSAVFAFGKIDLIRHSLIVVALLGIIVDDGGKPARIRDFRLIPAAYVASLALFLATYYMVHAELFGTTVL